jgi:hypothetical protein
LSGFRLNADKCCGHVKDCEMKRRSFAMIGLGLGAAVSLGFVAIPSEPVRASGPTFVIPANDGYGIGECVESGTSCGKVVADSWCEAQGFGRSASINVPDVETTGSTEPARRAISVTCAN